LLTTFRSQIAVMLAVIILWLIGSRNLVATHLPLIGRLAPLDSWWTTWRHFFASWSPNGLGTGTPGMPGYGRARLRGHLRLRPHGHPAPPGPDRGGAARGHRVGRLLRGRVSNRARVVAAVSYMALPLGLNMIGQGRIDVLVVVTGLPLVVRRLFELLAVPGFRSGPTPIRCPSATVGGAPPLRSAHAARGARRPPHHDGAGHAGARRPGGGGRDGVASLRARRAERNVRPWRLLAPSA
jgi:hypothetical protein